MNEELATNKGSIHQAISKPGESENQDNRSWEIYQQFHESAPIGYLVLDINNIILDVNIAGAQLLGAPRERLIGNHLTAFIANRFEADFRNCLQNIQESKKWQECETEIIRTDSSKFFAMIQGREIESTRELVLFISDITERKRTESALRESEQKYKEVADRLAEGVFETDTSGRVTYANHKILASFQLSEDDLKSGIKVFDVIDPQNLALARERIGKVLRQEDVGAGEYLLARKDGTTFPGLVHSLSIVREGKVVGIRGIMIDISERKQVDSALQESERKYRELTDLLDEGVFEMDRTGKFTYANRKGLAYLGVDENDLMNGLNVFDIISPQDLERAKERLAMAVNQQDTGPVEFLIVRKDGTTFPAITHGSAIVRDSVVVGIRGVVFDISELKKTEQALRESEERFRTFVKSLHEGIWVLDKDDITTFVNPRMAEMLGYTEEEMLGNPVYSFNDEEWKKFTVEKMEQRRQGITEQIEGELLRKDGGRVYALIEASPILDEDGNYNGSIAGIQDITERKNAEEKLKQTMVELDSSNKELEQFAYVTSHDLREPLRMMTSFSQSLEKRYKDKLDSTANEYIHFIVDGAQRMQKLIDDILVYSRVTTRGQPFEPVEMGKIFDEVLLNLKASVDETMAKITCDLLPIIQADPAQMKQVLQNLIANAIKFHKKEEIPVIHISAKHEDNEWLFSVKDNGIGMDPELFGRLFNLFQRLHPPDKYPGTGVGLAVTKKIVQRHGGRIWVESQPGKGSTFHFSIPLTIKVEKDVRE